MRALILIPVLFLSFPLATAAATSMYVTDRVPVGLLGANDAAAPVVKQLFSGAPLQVLERDGELFKVRSEDGSVGWIDPSLLSNEKSLQLLYAETRDQLNKTQKELKALQDKGAAPAVASRDDSKLLADLRAELKGAHERSAELERVAQANALQLSDTTAKVAALESENMTLKSQAGGTAATSGIQTNPVEVAPAGVASANNRTSITLPWFIASSFLVLLLGGAIGAYAIDWYIRKRHGGFRIY